MTGNGKKLFLDAFNSSVQSKAEEERKRDKIDLKKRRICKKLEQKLRELVDSIPAPYRLDDFTCDTAIIFKIYVPEKYWYEERKSHFWEVGLYPFGLPKYGNQCVLSIRFFPMDAAGDEDNWRGYSFEIDEAVEKVSSKLGSILGYWKSFYERED